MNAMTLPRIVMSLFRSEAIHNDYVFKNDAFSIIISSNAQM